MQTDRTISYLSHLIDFGYNLISKSIINLTNISKPYSNSKKIKKENMNYIVNLNKLKKYLWKYRKRM